MPAAYQRSKATAGQAGDSSRAPFQAYAQWSGSEGQGNSVMTNLPGMSSSEESLLPLNASDGKSIVANQAVGWSAWTYRMRRFSLRQFIIIGVLLFVIFSGAWVALKNMKEVATVDGEPIDVYYPPMPELGMTAEDGSQPKEPGPVQWLRDNTYTDMDDLTNEEVRLIQSTRPKAAFIALVRNSELQGMVESITQVEARFNGHKTHQYDWVFFNNEEFSEEFKHAVAKATGAQCYFERIRPEHWQVPSWIDKTRFDVGRQFMGDIGVGKAWLESYHHMCRWNSGLFAFEDRLLDYDYYWRVEPDVQYTCDINYDVFRFMQDNNMTYGFNMAILEDQRSIPSLWESTAEFVAANEGMLDDEADFSWLLQDSAGDFDQDDHQGAAAHLLMSTLKYNNCQFYSNFEIGELDFFRGEKHTAFFNHLDKKGEFYYQRLGDAPFHTLSVSLFTPKRKIWYFRDIGYAHGICQQCPPHTTETVAVTERSDDLTDTVDTTTGEPVKQAEAKVGDKVVEDIAHETA